MSRSRWRAQMMMRAETRRRWMVEETQDNMNHDDVEEE